MYVTEKEAVFFNRCLFNIFPPKLCPQKKFAFYMVWKYSASNLKRPTFEMNTFYSGKSYAINFSDKNYRKHPNSDVNYRKKPFCLTGVCLTNSPQKVVHKKFCVLSGMEKRPVKFKTSYF